MNIETKNLGSVIAKIRQCCNLTQKQVAEMSGLTVNYLSLIENGDRGISIDGLNKLANVFKIPAEFITFLAGSKTRVKEFSELATVTKEAIWNLIKLRNCS